MVRKPLFVSLSALVMSFSTFAYLAAGEFTASVSGNEVPMNESFTLNLTLKDSSLKEGPDLSSLKQHFSIHSQQQMSNTSIINGKVSSSITWKLSLTPKTDGVTEIPSLTVDTKEGVLSTQPITLNVIKVSSPKSLEDSLGLSIINEASNASPYKNEPFFYRVLLTSKLPLYNIQTEKLQVDDAIVELVAKPKLEERIIGGVLLNVVEYSYLITPLKPGSLKIPSMEIQGAVPQKRKGKKASFFDDNLDPFDLMQGLERLKPFVLMTEEIPLNVLPAIPGMSPWLPARDITIEEEWASDQQLRVGEPFSRGFKIQGEGLKASQLPRLEELQKQEPSFKVYADKPVEQETLSKGIIHSSRKEQLTLIPQQAGTLELPEISINWWDSVKKEKRTSTVPARTVTVLPALDASKPNSNEADVTLTPPEALNPPYMLYGIIAVLTTSLAAAFLWVFLLQRKINSLTNEPLQRPQATQLIKSPTPSAASETKTKNEKLPDLNPT